MSPERCSVCNVIDCVVVNHVGQTLTRVQGIRFARAVLADGADSPRAKILAKYILDITETP